MLHKLLRITLTVFVLTCFVSSVYASGSESTDHGPHDALDRAKRLESNAREEAQKQFDTLQTVNRLVGDLGLAYSAKSAAIAKGKTVTIAAGIGAIGSAVCSAWHVSHSCQTRSCCRSTATHVAVGFAIIQFANPAWQALQFV